MTTIVIITLCLFIAILAAIIIVARKQLYSCKQHIFYLESTKERLEKTNTNLVDECQVLESKVNEAYYDKEELILSNREKIRELQDRLTNKLEYNDRKMFEHEQLEAKYKTLNSTYHSLLANQKKWIKIQEDNDKLRIDNQTLLSHIAESSVKSK